jgi:putative PIN family toxin of toxin-antitoxin system
MAQYKLILDANIWISFAIGKRMLIVRDVVLDEQLEIFSCQQLLDEFITVVQRPKLQKYLSGQRCNEALALIEMATHKIEPKYLVSVSRDSKDNYLLALAQTVKADYLITGDEDLLVLESFGTTKIMRFAEFFELFQQL